MKKKLLSVFTTLINNLDEDENKIFFIFLIQSTYPKFIIQLKEFHESTK